jgi:serine/threonine-protein kinase
MTPPPSSGLAAAPPASSAPPQPPSSASPAAGSARPRWLVPATAALAGVALIAATLVATGNLRLGTRRGGVRAGDVPAPPPPPLRPHSGTTDRKMIVVLPFENLGAAEDAYFAAGMTEEFTSRLARVSGLGVISRTSAVQYDRAGKTLRQIGEDLGVDFVLEGTVRWERREGGASRVRVTPQLIRVADDTHVWSDTYDREIEDLFSVQSEIATNVVRSLGVTLLEPERNVLEARPTENLEAYQAYVRSKEHEDGLTGDDIRLEARLLERAVELDSTFALAWAGLSRAHSKLYHFGIDRSEARISQARAANDRAFALAPGLPEAEIAEGYYHYWIHRDFPPALAAFARAEKSLPNDSEVLEAIAFTWRRQGRFEEAVEKLKKAFEISPNEASILAHIGESYVYLRQYEEAISYFDRALALKPDLAIAHTWKSEVLVCKGDLRGARALLERVPEDPDGEATLTAFRLDLAERKIDDAKQRLAAYPKDVIEEQWNFLPKSLLLGVAQMLAGDAASGRASLEAARARLESELVSRPDDHRVHSALGVVLARLGEKEAAIREGKRGAELFPVSKDAMIGPNRLLDLAGIYATTGEVEAALDQLEYLASIPTGPWFTLRLDPRWDALRDQPRFRRLLEKAPS